MSDYLVVKNAVRFICPFCGREATTSNDPSSVFHALPTCERFDKLEVTEYLAAVNEKLGNSRRPS